MIATPAVLAPTKLRSTPALLGEVEMINRSVQPIPTSIAKRPRPPPAAKEQPDKTKAPKPAKKKATRTTKDGHRWIHRRPPPLVEVDQALVCRLGKKLMEWLMEEATMPARPALSFRKVDEVSMFFCLFEELA